MGENVIGKLGKGKRAWIYIILTGLAVSLLAFIPMISAEGIYMGADGTFHLARIESMADAMREGVFPVKIHFSCEFGFGYGSGFFYPNFLLYFPAVLMLFGMTLDGAYKIFAFGVFISIFFSTYISIYMITKRECQSVIAAALMVLSTPLFFSVYNLFSLGNSTAMIFMIPAICGAWGVMQISDDSMLEFQYLLLFGGVPGISIDTYIISLFYICCVCGCYAVIH